MGGTVDVDITQYGSVIGLTFLPTIHMICSSRSWVQRHSVGVCTGGGTVVWGGYPDIRGFRQCILMQRRLQGPSNMRVAAKTRCDANDFRLHFLQLGKLQRERRFFMITGSLWLPLSGRNLACRYLRYIITERYNVIVISFIIWHSTNSHIRCPSRDYWFTDLQ